MSLIDDLRAAAELLPPSHVPTVNELPQILGALLAHVEHGHESFVKAVENGFDGFVHLLAPTEADGAPQDAAVPAADQPAPSAAGAGPAVAPDPAAGDLQSLEQENAALRDQIAALQGSQQHPGVTVSSTPDSAPPADQPSVS